MIKFFFFSLTKSSQTDKRQDEVDLCTEVEFIIERTSSEQFLLNNLRDWVPCGSFTKEHMPLEPDI